MASHLRAKFVRQHADQILATHFFAMDTVWLKALYVNFFIEVDSRPIHLAGITAPTPPGEWMTQQTRPLARRLQETSLLHRQQYMRNELAPTD